jgi:hypothetical protein
MIFPPNNFTPKYLSHVKNWHGHVSFAHDIVMLLKPKVIVELGVHYGDSYFTFCQTVDELELDCNCFGVDSWTGDEHTGYYDPNVYDLVKEENIKYNKFSNLIKCSFSNALDQFDDGSIDLLHLDGCHTYEAVSCDFHEWKSKVRSNGIILFHDVSIQREDFGVYKFWEEITPKYPTVMFSHSCGLGVVENSLNADSFSIDFLNSPNEDFGEYYELLSKRAILDNQIKSFLE